MIIMRGVINSVSFVVSFVLVIIVQCEPPQPLYGPVSNDQEEIKSQDGDDSRIRVVQPLTFGAALQAEVQRLQRLNDVFPPPSDSYFVPYGDRTIVSMQLPTFNDQDLASANMFGKSGGGLGVGQEYGPPVYGPPTKGWGSPNKLRKSKDFGVITSQNYVYRKNVRDYAGFSKIFENSRSSQDILTDVGKLLLTRRKSKQASAVEEQGSSLGNLLNIDVLKGLSKGYGPPPIDAKGWDWEQKKKKKKVQSFALVAIESRVRVSEREPRELSLTNGSIIFPSSSNPNVLTFVPFILRAPGDAENVFCGYENDLKGIPLEEKRDLISLLKMAEGIHEDAHLDGKERLHRVRKLSDSLSRPRLPKTELFQDDPLEQEDSKARETLWLYTSTIALRTLSPPPEKKLWPVVSLVPIVDSYREDKLPVIDYGVVPVGPVVLLDHPSFGDVPPLPYGFEGPPVFQDGTYAEAAAFTQPEVSVVEDKPASSSSSSYFYRTIKQ